MEDFFDRKQFYYFPAREVSSSATVRFENPLILELEYILYYGEISLGATPRFSFFNGMDVHYGVKFVLHL